MRPATQPKQVRELPLDRITCAPQVREQFDEEELAGLAQSLREVGLQQPILVRPTGEKWEVIDGERRTRAARLAGLTSISALVDDEKLSNADVIQRQLVVAVQRADLRPVEKARAIDRLMKEAGWSATQVAAKLGLSPATVSKLLALLVLSEGDQKLVNDGQIAASTAYEVAKTRDAGERAQMLNEARQGRLTRDSVTSRRRARASARPTSRARSRRPCERVVFALGDKGSVSIADADATLDVVVVWIEALLERLRALESSNMALRDAATALKEAGDGAPGAVEVAK